MDEKESEDEKRLTDEELEELIKLHKDSGSAEKLFVEARYHRG